MSFAVNRAGVNTATDASRKRQAAAGKVGDCQGLRVERCLATLCRDRGAGQGGVAGDRHIGIAIGRGNASHSGGLGTVGQVDASPETATASTFAAASRFEIQRQREFILLKRGHGQIAANIGVDRATLDHGAGQGGVAARRQGETASGGDPGLRRVQAAVDEVEINTETALIGAAFLAAAASFKPDAKLVLGILDGGDCELAANVHIGIVAGNDLQRLSGWHRRLSSGQDCC